MKYAERSSGELRKPTYITTPVLASTVTER